MNKEDIDVSIIITCYNEKHILESNNVEIICKVFDNTKYNYEIIFVDDGSTDGSVELLEEWAKKNNNMRVVLHEENKGRGRSVEDGIIHANGRIVGFNDIDLSTPAYYMPILCSEIDNGVDIATARRIYKIDLSGIYKSFHRLILTEGYKLLARYFLGIRLIDTISGCKFFKKETIQPLLKDVLDNHWFWDTEIMVRSYFAGLKIKEIPTVFIRKPQYGSTVKIVRDTLDYLKNLIKFRKIVKELRKSKDK